MLDSIGAVMQPPRSDDWGLNRVGNWHLKFCWIPRTCFLTGKRIWVRHCYAGSRVITGPGEPVHDEYYVDRDAFIIWQLRGNHGII